MTNLQLLKSIEKGHPRNMSLLAKGYIITNNDFFFRNGKKAKELLNLYIEREYNDLRKNDEKNQLMPYSEYHKQRIDYFRNKNDDKYAIDAIEIIFKFYEQKRDIEILEIKKDEKFHYIKLGENKYYILDNKYLDLIKEIFEGLSLIILSGKYETELGEIIPLGIKDYNTGYIVGAIMPIRTELSDYDFEQI